MNAEDSIHESQICETNKLGNALLCGLVAEGISGSKRTTKIQPSLKQLNENLFNYKNEVSKLKYVTINKFSYKPFL